MAYSFRLVPPEPRSDAVSRPRLLRRLAGRWQHRVTSLVGGPGLGKTTVLAQAIAENRLVPRGDDVWIGLEPQDRDADSLARLVARAVLEVGRGGPGRDGDVAPTPLDQLTSRPQELPEPAAVAESLWQRAPTETCLVLDDVHHLPPASSGADWLRALVDTLPANGHVLLSGRSEPPVPLTRLGTLGAVLRLAEEQLRFDDEELSSFAARRGVDPGQFGDTGGWPAMAELIASIDQRLTGRYLWEEVLEPLGTVRRHVLAVLSDLGGGDDELVSAAVGSPVELAEVLEGVPLVACGAGGWYRAHGLWRTAPGIELGDRERGEVRRRAADHLSGRGRFDEALRLLQEAELWEATPLVLRRACLASARLAADELGRWLSASSDSVRTSPAGALATGLHTALTAPADAIEPLRLAAARCQAAGDVDAELAALAQLGQLAWWRRNVSLFLELRPRVLELEAAGHPTARGMAAFGRAVEADLEGDDARVLAELDSIEPSALDPAWEISAAVMRCYVHLYRDEPQAVVDTVERLWPTAEPALRTLLEFVRLVAGWWSRGEVDELVDRIPGLLDEVRATGVTTQLHASLLAATMYHAWVGDVVAARRCFEEAQAIAPVGPEGRPRRRVEVTAAVLSLAEGDEKQAGETLREIVERHGPDLGLVRGIDRHNWQHLLGMVYVLVPEVRDHWDHVPLSGPLRLRRDLAAAVVARREGQIVERLRALELPDPARVRAALPTALAAELAVGLHAAGRPEGRAILDALGAPGRATVRALAETRPPQAKPARALLAAVPTPPQRSTYVAVLGPLVVRRDGPAGEEVLDPDLHRKRLHELLGYLVAHRRSTRSLIAAALWPDLDERAAGNNLAVTLNHVLRLLDPWRDKGEPSYLLRQDGQVVRLVTGEHLRVDVDEFDAHLDAAARAETDGTPSVALQHLLAAVDVYRGDLHLELTEAEWFALDREHYRSRFVGAAIRAGQLLVGRGDPDQAAEVALRALTVDPWSEEAYGVLVTAALARGDRSAARRLLRRCLAVLDELGAQPSPATQLLERRIQGAAAPHR